LANLTESGLTESNRAGGDFRDIQAVTFDAEAVARGGADLAGLLANMGRMSRDQGHTAVHWDTTPGAGFTTGTPWIGISPDHVTVNAATQVDDPDSGAE
jgi:oligo-1,6-glucosidase